MDQITRCENDSALALVGANLSHESPFIAHTRAFPTEAPDGKAPRSRRRGLDLVLALTLLTMAAPVMLAIALLVRRDRGPALFRQERIGLGGRPFTCLKYRTMVVDAEQRLAALLEADPRSRAEWLSSQKLRADPRVTPIGRWLRRTSLDELPQLLNVIRGEMSLVGPRPIVREEIVRYGSAFEKYLRVRPGLTGLWQISGRNNIGYETRVQLDVWYIENGSLFTYLRILARTAIVVLQRKGAY